MEAKDLKNLMEREFDTLGSMLDAILIACKDGRYPPKSISVKNAKEGGFPFERHDYVEVITDFDKTIRIGFFNYESVNGKCGFIPKTYLYFLPHSMDLNELFFKKRAHDFKKEILQRKEEPGVLVICPWAELEGIDVYTVNPELVEERICNNSWIEADETTMNDIKRLFTFTYDPEEKTLEEQYPDSFKKVQEQRLAEFRAFLADPRWRNEHFEMNLHRFLGVEKEFHNQCLLASPDLTYTEKMILRSVGVYSLDWEDHILFPNMGFILDDDALL